MTNAEHGFARMAERSVSDVVENQRRTHQAALISDVVFICKELAPVVQQLVEGARSGGERAEGVTEPRMFRRRERKIGQAELAQAAQALKCGRVQQASLCGLQLDEMVDGIVNPLHMNRTCKFCGSGGDSGEAAKMR